MAEGASSPSFRAAGFVVPSAAREESRVWFAASIWTALAAPFGGNLERHLAMLGAALERKRDVIRALESLHRGVEVAQISDRLISHARQDVAALDTGLRRVTADVGHQHTAARLRVKVIGDLVRQVLHGDAQGANRFRPIRWS